jgi:Cytosine deaminase and related metal-dependent hydrolases
MESISQKNILENILLEHGTIITMDEKRRIIMENGSVLIEGNRVAAVGKELKEKAEKRIDCKNKLILPGLIDCHVHLAQALLRGSADDLALVPWLRGRVWPLQSTYNSEIGRLSAQLCMIEMIKSGTTTFVECMLHTKYGFDEIAKEVESTGLRAVLSKTLMDMPYYADQSMYEGMIETKEGSMKETISMIQKYHGKANNRIHVWFGPRTPGACSPEFYREMSARAKEYDVGITLHLAETKGDIVFLKKEYGMTPIEFMEHCGLVGKHVIYVHGVWLPKSDFPKIKGTVCHCPASNLKLASGFAPVEELINANVNVALGCDGAPCNNTYDMIKEMRLAALIQKPRLMDPRVLPAEKVLEMATINGAKPTHWNKELGSIEKGKLADLIIIDLHKPHLIPMRNPVSTLVYSANGSDVDTVIVDGKLLMENRELKTINEAKVIDEVMEKGLLPDKKAGLNIRSRWPTV